MTKTEGRLFTPKLLAALFALLAVLLLAPLSVGAEGSKDLVANGGSRPFLEWNNTTTMGLNRTQLIYVYANEGETIYFGSSVASGYSAVNGASVGVMMPTADGKTYADANADFKKNPAAFSAIAANRYGTLNPTIASTSARDKVYLYKATGDIGYINTLTKEAAGPNTLNGAAGYTPFSITVPQGCSGVWTFMFYSQSYEKANPTPTSATSANFVSNQGKSMVGAWDVTVANKNGAAVSGRVACERLFLNMGGNDNGIQLNSVVYALTRLGFAYKINFNGADPYGFVFYVNNRGLLRKNSDNSYQSLMHSAIASNNEMNSFVNKAGQSLDFLANAIPTQAGVDETYLLFFNTPDAEYIKVATERGKVLTQDDVTNQNIRSVEFVGMNREGEFGALTNNVAPATEGCGGRFVIEMEEGSIASSFKITIDMTGNKTLCETYGYETDRQNIITLSNAVVDGKGEVQWDGKDAFGNVVPARVAPYDDKDIKVSIIATAGEVHLPLLDVENNANGIQVEMLNNLDTPNAADKTTVHYNNSNDKSGAYGYYGGVYNIGDTSDASTGVDTSVNGAMKYTNKNGNQCALDMWAYFVVQTKDNISLAIKIVKEVELEVHKTWQTASASGEVDSNPPSSITVHLQWRLTGETVWTDYAGRVEAYKADMRIPTSESYRFVGMELFPASAEGELTSDESKRYEYRVREVTENLSRYVLTADSAADESVSMSSSLGTENTTGVLTYTQTLTNTYKGSDVQLNVTKMWVTTSESGEVDSNAPTTITLRLQQRAVGTADWTSYNGLVTEYTELVTFDTTQNDGVYSFKGLEFSDENGTPYEYRVEETELENYRLTDSQPADSTEAMSYTTVTILSTSVRLYTQNLTNTYRPLISGGNSSWVPAGATGGNVKIAFKYLYGYNDGAAGIYGANKRYSAQSDGYYYLNTEEAAALIYRVRLQEGAVSAPTEGAAFEDVPVNGWALHALTFLQNIIGFKTSARKPVSSSTLQQMIQAHYGEGQTLDLSGTNVTRMDFLRAFNATLGRTSVTEIHAADGTLLCSYAGGFYTVTVDASRYYFASEMPTKGEEIYQVLLACHSYRIYNNGTIAVIAPDLERSRYDLDQGDVEADEEAPAPMTLAVNFFAALFGKDTAVQAESAPEEQSTVTEAESAPASESTATAESVATVEETATVDMDTVSAG